MMAYPQGGYSLRIQVLLKVVAEEVVIGSNSKVIKLNRDNSSLYQDMVHKGHRVKAFWDSSSNNSLG